MAFLTAKGRNNTTFYSSLIGLGALRESSVAFMNDWIWNGWQSRGRVAGLRHLTTMKTDELYFKSESARALKPIGSKDLTNLLMQRINKAIIF